MCACRDVKVQRKHVRNVSVSAETLTFVNLSTLPTVANLLLNFVKVHRRLPQHRSTLSKFADDITDFAFAKYLLCVIAFSATHAALRPPRALTRATTLSNADITFSYSRNQISREEECDRFARAPNGNQRINASEFVHHSPGNITRDICVEIVRRQRIISAQ